MSKKKDQTQTGDSVEEIIEELTEELTDELTEKGTATKTREKGENTTEEVDESLQDTKAEQVGNRDEDIDEDQLEETEEDVDYEVLVPQLREQLESQNEMVLRAQAEMQNVRRRSEKEVSNARKYALEGFMRDFIAILDSFEGALKTEIESDWPDSAKGLHEGIEGIAKQFDDVFGKNHIVIDRPAQGEKFDPQVHEAVSMIAMPGVGKDQIVETVRTGYRVNDRVIRPAMVVVSTGG